MANLTRPPLPSSTERRTRHGKSPATDEPENVAHHNNTTISTRRSSRGAPLVSLDLEHSARSASSTAAKPATLARANSRKRPAAAVIADATTDPRPPTKVTVTQPHGPLLQTTNTCADTDTVLLSKHVLRAAQRLLQIPFNQSSIRGDIVLCEAISL